MLLLVFNCIVTKLYFKNIHFLVLFFVVLKIEFSLYWIFMRLKLKKMVVCQKNEK